MMNPCRKLSEMNIQEINSNLSDFVRSLRRPNGKEYRPDIILYFLYGTFHLIIEIDRCFHSARLNYQQLCFHFL